MTLRVITVAGTLELGKPPPGDGPACASCKGPAQVELDADTGVRGRVHGVLTIIETVGTRRVALCVPCLERTVGHRLDRNGKLK